MSYNGSGTYALPVPPTFPAVSGTVISSTYFNNTLNDIKDALNVVFCRDGQAAATGDWNLAGFVLSGLKQDATALALSVFGDDNTGIRFPAADTGQLIAGGVGPLTWTAVGGTIAGVWTAATAADGTDTTQIATTEYVQGTVDTILTDPEITGCIKEDVYTIADGAGFQIDPGNGSIQHVTLGGNRTPQATNFASGESVLLSINDGAGHTMNWTTIGVVWTDASGSVAPVLSTTGLTWIELWKVSTTVYGTIVGYTT